MEDIEEIKRRMLKDIIKKIREKEEISKYPGRPIHADATKFHEIISSYRFVIVDFYADWCYPCQMLSPIIEELAEEYRGRVVFVKVNVDENQQLALKYGVMGVPTLVFIIDGREVDRIVGYVPKEYLKTKIEKYLY